MKSQYQPIAIVGMACRFPGGCDTPDKFWQLLTSGTDVITEINEDRWSKDYYFHPDSRTSGKTYTTAAGQLADIYQFDPAFFGITPREAAQMDPQQRLLLQMSWEALEDGNQLPERLAGTDCSVYVGISSLDYANNRMDDPNVADAYFMTGNTLSIAANRLSYIYDLHGPSMAIDTACSSSLVALHQACSGIWSGESTSSIVGAIHLVLSPFPFIGFSKANMLSSDGRCKVFGAGADGYVRSEGGVVLYLKALEQALQDGDPVHAVIRGTAVNSDGNKSALTVPNGVAQQRLLKQVYQRAGIDLNEISYIEAHGTGTPVGDPIEAEAIGSALGMERSGGEPLRIGSVKSNIGHLEPASGFAGLMKVILSLKHRAIPATIHQTELNPNIDFERLNLRVVNGYQSLQDSTTPLVMGINSFGFGGTNAHTILEEYQHTEKNQSGLVNDAMPPLYLSARSEESLRLRAGQFSAYLDRELSGQEIYDIFYNCAVRRQRQAHSIVVHGDSISAIRGALEQFYNGKRSENLIRTDANPGDGKIAFIFSGNGSQWAGMGKQLLALPTFSEIIDQINTEFEPLAGWSIREAMLRDDPGLEYTEVAQPLLFALQVGLVRLLEELGVTPDAVAGHSVGEIAAAHVCGALSLFDAVRVIYYRSGAQGRTKGQGRMAAVRLPAGDMGQWLETYNGKVEIAAINSTNSVTISGDGECIHELTQALRRGSVSCRELDIDYAFHSRMMDSIKDYIIEQLADIQPGIAQIIFQSTVTGKPVADGQLDSEYWWNNIRQPVQFGPAITSLLQDGVEHFIEIGPHPVLQSYVRDTMRDIASGGSFIRTLSRNDSNESHSLLTTAYKSLFAHTRYSLDQVFPVEGNHVTLPPYPWNSSEYIFSGSNEAINRHRDHELLGYRLNALDGIWTNQIDIELCPWLADHVVDGIVLFPAAGFAEMALAAARLWTGKNTVAVANLEIRKPLILEPGKTRSTVFTLSGKDMHFSIRSRERLSDDSWVEHATGKLLTVQKNQARGSRTLDMERLLDRDPAIISKETVYQNASACGLGYGFAFQGVKRVLLGSDATVLTEIELPAGDRNESGSFHLHPVILDSAFHTLFSLIQNGDDSEGHFTYIPTEINTIQLYSATGGHHYSECIIHKSTPHLIRASFNLFDQNGILIAEIRECLFRRLPRSESQRHTPSYYRYSEIPKNLINAGEISPLPAMDMLVECASRLQDREDLVHSETLVTEQVIPLFDAMASAIAENTFREFGAHLGQFTVDSLVSGSMIPAEFKPYLAYLLTILEQDGKANRQENHWKMLDTDDSDDPVEIWRSILADYPQYVGQLRDAASHGLSMKEIMTSQKYEDRDEIIYPTRLADPGISPLQEAMLQLILEQVTRKWPHKTRRLRIAEIRSQRTHSSMDIISLLPESYCDYEILALDNTILTQAEEIYRDNANVTVSLFDPSKANLQQKYREGEFDMVLISQGLNRYLSLTDIFNQVSYILASSGLLLLLDKRPDRMTDLNMGLCHPDWWCSSADEGTPLSSQLHPDEWLYLLENTGYEESINLMDKIAGDMYRYVIAASRVARTTNTISRAVDQDASCFLVACDGSDSNRVAQLLKTETVRDGVQATMIIGNGSERGEEGMIILDLLEHSDQQELTRMLETRGDKHVKIVYLAGINEKHSESSALDIGHRVSRTNMRLLNFIKALTAATLETIPSVWVVTSGAVNTSSIKDINFNPNPYQAGIWATGRVIRNEYPDIDLRMIDLQTGEKPNRVSRMLWNEIHNGDGEEEVILTDSGRKAIRIDETDMRVEVVDRDNLNHINRTYQLDFSRAGSIENLEWHGHERLIPADDEVEIEVRATGINFRDIMYTTGFLPAEMLEGGLSGASLGLECSGVVTRLGANVDKFEVGDEVIALAPACFSSHIIASRYAVTRKPAEWSFEAAATIPTAFFTVYYSLNYLARLRAGERILIHGAAGGVGLAAIQYAHYCGAEIFATAGTPEKRKFLEYLGVDHVLDSRSLEFADQIMSITSNEGIDVVLNSLAGEAMSRNFRVLRPFGRFLELGKRDFFENTRMDLKPFRNNITYFGIDADQLLQHEPELSSTLMQDVMHLFDEGVFRPLPYTSFSASEVESAFRYMQQSQHIGKVVVTQNSRSLKVRRESDRSQLVLNPEATYLVTGGGRGFGLATAAWMAQRGARHLVLLGRNGVRDVSARETIEKLQEDGVDVRVMKCDVTDAIKMQSVLHDINESGYPLKGIVHAAMVLDDKLIHNLGYQSMYDVIAPKVQGAWNLHKLTREYDLDLFVLYSSATTTIGNPGQANYVAANAFLESLAKLRRKSGLTATVISWDAITDAGYLLRNEELAGHLAKRMGLGGMTTDQAFQAMERLIVTDQTESVVFNANWSALKRALPLLNSHMYRNIMHGLDINDNLGGDDLIEMLANIDDSERQPMVVNFLIAEIARILQMPEEKIAHNCSIQDLGIDSLMAMELATTIEMKLGIDLPVMTLVDNVTLDGLANRIISMLHPSTSNDGQQTGGVDDIVTSLAKKHAEDLSEEELQSLTRDIDKDSANGKRLIQ